MFLVFVDVNQQRQSPLQPAYPTVWSLCHAVQVSPKASASRSRLDEADVGASPPGSFVTARSGATSVTRSGSMSTVVPDADMDDDDSGTMPEASAGGCPRTQTTPLLDRLCADCNGSTVAVFPARSDRLYAHWKRQVNAFHLLSCDSLYPSAAAISPQNGTRQV